MKAELGSFSEYFENRKEFYGMDWPGKREALKLIQTPSMAALKPNREESVNFDTTENLYIEGDNLEVLKLLQKSYYGKVKMIYIDPPYNTGKEFIYPDDFTESLDTYLEYAGLVDSEGKKFATNTANEGRFHTKWLNMMYPRLYLARNLLEDNGVISISIDDNEIANLRKMCDEIFGEDNFIGQLTVENDSRARQYGSIATTHEYLLIYSKNQNYIHNVLTEENKSFQYQDDDGGFDIYELRNRNIAFNINNRPNLYYPFWVNPNSKDKNGFYEISLNEISGWEITYPQESQGVKTVWRWGKEKASKNLNTNLIARKHSGGFYQIIKKYRGNTFAYNSVWTDKEIKTDKGTLEIKKLFDNKKIFDFPKPTEFIKRILSVFSQEDSIVLDFFSGSASTAHAVLIKNSQDTDSKCRFIMIQLPEPCAEDSEAFKAGYKTISDIGKERIRRVIKKLDEEDAEKLELSSNVKQDRGFKVLKLNKSNFKQWQKLDSNAAPEKIEEQLELSINHIEDGTKPEDLLYEVLIKAGFMPTENIEKKTIAGKMVFSIADGALLICFEDLITKELIEEISKAKPMRFYCLDSAFGANDQLKANAVQTFRSYNQGKEKEEQIIFITI